MLPLYPRVNPKQLHTSTFFYSLVATNSFRFVFFFLYRCILIALCFWDLHSILLHTSILIAPVDPNPDCIVSQHQRNLILSNLAKRKTHELPKVATNRHLSNPLRHSTYTNIPLRIYLLTVAPCDPDFRQPLHQHHLLISISANSSIPSITIAPKRYH